MDERVLSPAARFDLLKYRKLVFLKLKNAAGWLAEKRQPIRRTPRRTRPPMESSAVCTLPRWMPAGTLQRPPHPSGWIRRPLMLRGE